MIATSTTPPTTRPLSVRRSPSTHYTGTSHIGLKGFPEIARKPDSMPAQQTIQRWSRGIMSGFALDFSLG